MELRFKLLDDAARVPTRANPDDAGLDLYAAEAATIEPGGGRAAVGTGLAVEIPRARAASSCHGPGSPRAWDHARQRPRADRPGLPRRAARAAAQHRPGEPFEVEPGDRIAQLLVVALADPDPVEVSELSGAARGDRGFGSSGS